MQSGAERSGAGTNEPDGDRMDSGTKTFGRFNYGASVLTASVSLVTRQPNAAAIDQQSVVRDKRLA